MVRIIITLVLFVCVCAPTFVAAQERPMIQSRFAEKDGSIYLHAIGGTHIRNDFYNAWSAGLDIGYNLSESLGAEVRGQLIRTRLSDAALDLKERTGLSPDARPQDSMILGGVRLSFGYGKILVWDGFVLHFDPQATLHGGVAFAEARVLPTVTSGLSLLLHFSWGIQLKLDLPLSFQTESRDRGTVASFGFLPTLGIGWSFNLGDL